MSEVDSSDPLDLIAEAHAIPAQHALVRIAHQRDRREVQFGELMHGFETHFADAQLAGDVLKLASGALGTGRALLVMVGQQQLNRYLPYLANLFRLRAHLQARFGRSRAGALDAAALDIHQAEAASPIDAEVRMIAERRQVDARFANQLQQIALAVERHLAPVNGQCLGSFGGGHVAFN